MKKFLAVLLFIFLIIPQAHAEVVPGDVIVVLRNTSGVQLSAASSAGGLQSLSSVQSFSESVSAKVSQTYDSLSEQSGHVFMVIHSDTKNESDLLREVRANPNVIAASLNRVIHLCEDDTEAENIPNDPEYFRLWGMEAIHAPQAWTLSTGSDDVYVAVVDSGIDYNHPDLKDNFSHQYSRNFLEQGTSGYDPSAYYDERGHGTHVAGTIAGIGNNALGVAGVNWRAKVISLRILDKNGRGTDADMIAAFNYLAGLFTKEPDLKIAAVNFSVGGYAAISPENLIAENDPTWLALKLLSDMDRAVICAAAGNETNDVGRPVLSADTGLVKGYYAQIASYLGIDSMITVAAADSTLDMAWFSNYSNKYVDIAAPGTNVFSSLPLTLSNDTGYAVLPRIYPYASYNGTSMATPHVAGSAALLKAMYPDATASQIKAAILGGANGDYLRDDGTSAHGFLDLMGAIRFMEASMSESTAPKISDAVVPDGGLGQRYKTEFYASGTHPINWELDGELPEGLTFENGRISGTPKESGTFPFTVTALNDYGESSLVLTLKIEDAIAPVLDMSTMSYDTLAAIDSGVRITLMTSAGTWPMFWSIESGDVPADLQLRITRDSGVLRFSPTKAGTFTFPVYVSNDAGQDSAVFTLNIREAKAPEILYTSDDVLGTATLGRPYKSYRVSTRGYSKTFDLNSSIKASGTRPILWDIQGLPKGLTFALNNPDDVTKSAVNISGKPEESGDFTLRVTASNAFGTASIDIPFTVEDTKPAFLEDVTAFAKRGLEADTEFSQPFAVQGSAPIRFTISGDLPEGTYMRFEDNTPIFFGKPAKTGHYTFTIIAENSCGQDETTLEVNVIPPSAIVTYRLPDAVKGVSYDTKIALRSDVSMNWSIFVYPESLNLKISQTGEITGTPAETGQFSVIVSASQDIDTAFAGTYILWVKALPAITTANLPDGTQNTPYTTTILSADGTAPINWTLSEGTLPRGLTLAQNGYILGTPTESGTFIFSLTASNTVGQDSKTFTLTIASDGTVQPESPDEPVIPDVPDSPDIPTAHVTQGQTRGVSSLTVEQYSSLTAGNSMIAAILPELSVNVSGTYTSSDAACFGNIAISSDVPAGSLLVWNAFASGTTDSYSDSAVFYDTDGQEISTVPENHIVNVAAYLETGKIYAPVISAVISENAGSVGSSGGGCDLGISALGLILCAVVFRKNSH